MILLLDEPDCIREDIWFHIGDAWRSAIQGIGPHKDCLLPTRTTTTSTSTTSHTNSSSNNHRNNDDDDTKNNHMNDNIKNNYPWETLVDLAIEHNLVMHPWTERPEMEFLSDPSNNNSSVWEELQTLFCHRGPVHGIFTEHLHLTIMATWWFSSGGCSESNMAAAMTTATTATTESSTSSSGGFNHNKNVTASNKMCYETDGEANVFVGIAAFIMGALLSAMATLWCVGHQRNTGEQFIFRRRGGGGGANSRRGMRIPDHDLELEMI
jgi:hypothetical protein